MTTALSTVRTMLAAALATGVLLANAQEGVSRQGVAIGQSVPLTGPGAAAGKPYQQGAKLYFDRVNAAGGVHGRKIDLVTMDDAGDAATAAANTRKLLDRGVLCLFGYGGSSQVAASYPLAKGSGVLMFAPLSAADEFHGPDFPNIYTLRPGYADEATAIARHVEMLGARRLAILHTGDGEALAAVASAQRSMTRLGAQLIARTVLSGSGVGRDIDQVLAAAPEAVLVVADPAGAAVVVRYLRAMKYRGPIYGFSNTGESLLADQLGAEGEGVVVARVVPKGENPQTQVARQLQADAVAAGLGKPNVYMLEGYIAAHVLVQALRDTSPEPTRAKLHHAIDSLRDFDVGGFRVHYNKERVGSRLVELAMIDAQGRVRE